MGIRFGTKTVERPDLALLFITASSYTRPLGIPKPVTGETHGSKRPSTTRIARMASSTLFMLNSLSFCESNCSMNVSRPRVKIVGKL